MDHAQPAPTGCQCRSRPGLHTASALATARPSSEVHTISVLKLEPRRPAGERGSHCSSPGLVMIRHPRRRRLPEHNYRLRPRLCRHSVGRGGEEAARDDSGRRLLYGAVCILLRYRAQLAVAKPQLRPASPHSVRRVSVGCAPSRKCVGWGWRVEQSSWGYSGSESGHRLETDRCKVRQHHYSRRCRPVPVSARRASVVSNRGSVCRPPATSADCRAVWGVGGILGDKVRHQNRK